LTGPLFKSCQCGEGTPCIDGPPWLASSLPGSTRDYRFPVELQVKAWSIAFLVHGSYRLSSGACSPTNSHSVESRDCGSAGEGACGVVVRHRPLLRGFPLHHRGCGVRRRLRTTSSGGGCAPTRTRRDYETCRPGAGRASASRLPWGASRRTRRNQ
jgi:hypothetical protein